MAKLPRAILPNVPHQTTRRGNRRQPVFSGERDPPSWQLDVLRQHVRTGRPLGAPDFVANVERRVGRPLAPAKRGRKRKVADTAIG